MKKIIVAMLCICTLVGNLYGCSENPGPTNPENANAMQILYDRSIIAKSFAEGQLDVYLSAQGVSDYTINQTNYGFIVSDDFFYLVGFEFSTTGKVQKYGYKISVDDCEQCSIIEEGPDVAESIFA